MADSTELQNLKHEITAFREWADKLPNHTPEWEVFYLWWDNIYDVVKEYVEKVPLNTWTSETFELLLYALARDNEDEVILHFLENYPEHLVALATKALTYGDYKARWQVAYGLSKLKNNQGVAKELLQQFLLDEEEYVRRRASFARV